MSAIYISQYHGESVIYVEYVLTGAPLFSHLFIAVVSFSFHFHLNFYHHFILSFSTPLLSYIKFNLYIFSKGEKEL